VFERFRAEVMGSTLLVCTGRLQREGIVIHVIADRLADLSRWLRRLSEPDPALARVGAPELAVRSHDFH
jgi:error-prone DNA polymerase